MSDQQKQPHGPLAWPWPADTPLDRARRVAAAYRAALETASPEECASLDAWARAHGQGWVAPSPWPYGDEDLLTPRQVAEACHVELRTVYRWHQRGLPYVDTPEGIRVRGLDLFRWECDRRASRQRAV